MCLYKILEIANSSSDGTQISGWAWGSGMGRARRITKWHKESFGDDGCVHDLDCGIGFMGIYIR